MLKQWLYFYGIVESKKRVEKGSDHWGGGWVGIEMEYFYNCIYRLYYNTPTTAWTYPNYLKPHTVNKMLPRQSTSESNIKLKYFLIYSRNADIGRNKDFALSAKWYVSFHLVCLCTRLIRNALQRTDSWTLQNSSLLEFQ